MRRRNLWTIANGSGIEKVHFGRLLSDSVVIIKPAREVYGLIGSDPSASRDLILEGQKDDALELSEQVEINPAPGSGVFDPCNPESISTKRAPGCVLDRSARLRAAGMWSLVADRMSGCEVRASYSRRERLP